MTDPILAHAVNTICSVIVYGYLLFHLVRNIIQREKETVGSSENSITFQAAEKSIEEFSVTL